MEKMYVKMNDNSYHLSLGNLFRIIKENSNIKTAALQIELFCIIFNIDDINYTTVNNYCTGYRSINDCYKQTYIVLRKEYSKDKSILKDILLNLLSIIEGTVIQSSNYDMTLNLVNKNNRLHRICIALYNISKNDVSTSQELQDKLKEYLDNNNLYDFISEVLFFTILDKKQPLFEKEEIIGTIEKIIENTTLSLNDIRDILKLNLTEGIFNIRGLRELANKGNPVACFQLGSLEFSGEITGTPRYIMAYKYFEMAASKDHPSANWMLGVIHSNAFINMEPNYELSWYYFQKSAKLGCIAAINSIGNYYLNGTVPGQKANLKKAISYFEQSANKGYVYAYNNLGKIYEMKNNYKKAFEYFIKSANQNESWAANKVGEYYRTGTGCEMNLVKAFEYYNISIDSSSDEVTHWSYYNLARYFYQYGCKELELEPNLNKALELYNESAKRGNPNALEQLNIIKQKLNIKD